MRVWEIEGKRECLEESMKKELTDSQVSECQCLSSGWVCQCNLQLRWMLFTGLQKNSPIKPRMDKIVTGIIEAGLIKKWMDDVMQKVTISNMQEKTENKKAIMNMKKFSGALVALAIGYILSILTLLIELCHFYFFIIRNPHYNKYSKQIVVEPHKNI